MKPARQSDAPAAGLAAPSRVAAWVSWLLVVTLALLCLWLAQLYFIARTEIALLRDQYQLAEFELRSARQQAEAERILAQHELAQLRDRAGAR